MKQETKKTNNKAWQNRKTKGKPQARKGFEGSKDSSSKRVNFDNERLSKYENRDNLIKHCDGIDRSNDPSWYARTPELLSAVANLGFYNNTGDPLQFTADITGSKYATPGVMNFLYAPTIGGIDNSPIMQATNSIYSYTVHANSRNISYDPADEMILILAGCEVFSFLALGIRAYGVMNLFDGLNSYLPQTLIAAMGFDYDDLDSNLSHMRADLNHRIASSRQIWVPNTMPLIARRFWMNSNIYMDSESVKGQFYLYTPAIIWEYDDKQSPTGGGLNSTNWFTASSTPNTWQGYLNRLDSMINKLLTAQYRGVIFGDILKAYGSENLYKVSMIPEDFAVTPVYSREVLSQMENITTFAQIPSQIQQTADGQLVTVYRATTASGGYKNPTGTPGRLLQLNFHQKEMPTPEQIMVATRLMASGQQPQLGNGDIVQAMQPEVCGSEIICLSFMYRNKLDADGNISISRTAFQSNEGIDNQPDLKVMSAWSKFDWAPAIYYTTIDQNWTDDKTIDYRPTGLIFESDNYIMVDIETLRRIHSAALLSEFGVPMFT